MLKCLRGGGHTTSIDLSPLNPLNLVPPKEFKNIEFKNIVIIAASSLRGEILAINEEIEFVDEDKIIEGLNLEKLKEIFTRSDIDLSSLGWYFQQFLKMAYSYICNEEFYLSFDSDALLVAPMYFDLNRPFLNAIPANLTNNHPYISTLNSILSIEHPLKYQFMSEFMLFNVRIMQDLMEALASKNKNFFENILSLVALDGQKYSFSEFETYGSFAAKYNIYDLKYYPVYRCGGRFFDSIPSFDNYLVREFAKKYFLLQFNHWDSVVPFAKVVKNKALLKIFGFNNLMRIYYYSGLYKRDFKQN